MVAISSTATFSTSAPVVPTSTAPATTLNTVVDCSLYVRLSRTRVFPGNTAGVWRESYPGMQMRVQRTWAT